MKILYKLATLALLLIVTITAEAQTTPPAGTPVITLTVTNNATITFRMAAAANNTPAWVETTPGTYTPITVGVSLAGSTATGTIIKVYGAITGFNCGWHNEKLIALDVSTNTALTNLDCSGNKLTSLDVSKNTALTTLDCSYNQLTTLDVSTNTALTDLYCFDNQLTSLDVSKNTALTFLRCDRNKLTSLDVSKNTALTTLDCFDNQLTSLDVSKNTALTVLGCDGNKLTSLDVSKNTALTKLYCSNNELTEIDVSLNTALTNLACFNNPLNSAAIDILYCSLPYRAAGDKAIICPAYSSTDANHASVLISNSSIATVKGWGVKYYTNSNDIPTTGIYTCGSPIVLITEVILNKVTATVESGQTVTLTATVTPDNATYKGLAWSSSNTAVATVDNNGLVTGVSAGIATVTATAVDGAAEANCVVTVVTPVTNITLNKTTATVETGKTIALTATVKPDNATNKTVIWSSANTAIATVDNNGLVTGVSAGIATITAKTEDGGYEATCVVTVTSTTGVETETATTLGLYPNPAMAELFIKGVEIPTLVEIYSTTGQLMLAQNLAPAQPINISHLQPGVYMVKVNGIAMKLMVAGR